jgi:maltose/moltooligosaccharide transporter
MKSGKEGFKPYLKLTFLIGFGFFTMGLMDPLYDTYVPIFLGKYVSSMTLVGFLMTIDNIFAIFLIPLFSVISDRTTTKIGRRMPFILVLLPLTAIFFGSLPYAAEASLGALIALIFCLNLVKQSARGPVVALMPDIIPAEFRSEANGVINTMGGIATIVGTIGLARLMDVDKVLPILGATKGRLPFPLAGILVVLAVILLFVFVKEKSKPQEAGKEEKQPLLASFAAVAKQKDKSALWILISLFLWFFGYQGVLPFIGKYSIDVLKTSPGTAALAAGMVGVAYAIFAIPSGYVAHKYGRKRTIRVSLVVLAVLTFVLFLHDPITAGFSPSLRLYSFWFVMFLFGMFWVSVVTNSFPMLWQMASWGTMGVYTGLYYTASQAAAILAPVITGAIIDLVGYRGIFIFCTICMLGAFAVMGLVKSGEADQEKPKLGQA